jgi:hypothetical protein
MKPSDSNGLLAPRNAPDKTLIQRALDAYNSACKQAGIEPRPIDTRRSTVRRSVWRGGYTGAIVILHHGKQTTAIYDVSAERRRRWDESESRVHWSLERAYTSEQLHPFEPLFAELKNWWSTQAAKLRQSGGASGSFVRGAGIAVRVLRPRCRHTDWQEIIHSPTREVGGASGCWEPFVDEILARLAAQGVEARYKPGCLD